MQSMKIRLLILLSITAIASIGINKIFQEREYQYEIYKNSEVNDFEYKWITDLKEKAIKYDLKETQKNINLSLEDNKVDINEFEKIRNSYQEESKNFEIKNLKKIQ